MCRHVFLNPITHYRNFSHFISCYYFYIFLVKRPLKAKRRLTILLTLSHTHIWYMAQWPKIGGKIIRLFASIGLQSHYVKKDFKNDFSLWCNLTITHTCYIHWTIFSLFFSLMCYGRFTQVQITIQLDFFLLPERLNQMESFHFCNWKSRLGKLYNLGSCHLCLTNELMYL